MIFQGIFNIFDLYFKEIELFYDGIDKYFGAKINNFFEKKLISSTDLKAELNEITSFLQNELIKLGFEQKVIEEKFSDQFLLIKKGELEKLNTPFERYKKKFAPIVYEIMLEKIVDYLIDHSCIPVMLSLKSAGLLPLEFVIELRNLKNLYKKIPEKFENLRKYLQIREKIIQKFRENKSKIEGLEDVKSPTDKLQLLYLIYRIIEFFQMQKIFDFSHLKTYLKEKVNEWLDTIPLVSLKNPDLYFCGLYLAINLNVNIDKNQIEEFLLNLLEENIDEFEAPFFEATDRIYYFFKSTQLTRLWISDEKVREIIKVDPRYFETAHLKNLETSQLVVILKIYNILGLYNKIESHKINLIVDEIDRRISLEGIKNYRDGFITSEATYYVLFFNYMINTLEKLKDIPILELIITRIYRNLEILNFSQDTNYDLVSEIFYSIECLKMLNCIETKELIIRLTNYLFPREIFEKISSIEKVSIESKARFRHFKVNRITGEMIY
jgi:hypothetical protein